MAAMNVKQIVKTNFRIMVIFMWMISFKGNIII